MAATDTAADHDHVEAVIKERQDLYDGPSGDTLPDALRDAEHDDTVCKVCGVSYLVFSEVKALEKRTLAAESAMASWKDKIERVKEVEAAADAANRRVAELEAAVSAAEDATAAAKAEGEEAFRAVEMEWRNKLLEARRDADADLKRAVANAVQQADIDASQQTMARRGLEMKLASLRRGLEAATSALAAQRSVVASIRLEVTHSQAAVADVASTCHQQAAALDAKHAAECHALRAELAAATERVAAGKRQRSDLDAVRQQVKTLQGQLSTAASDAAVAQAEVGRLRSQLDDASGLKQVVTAQGRERDDLQRQLAAVTSELAASQDAVATLQRQYAVASADAQRATEQLSALQATHQAAQAAAAAAATDAAAAAKAAAGENQALKAMLAQLAADSKAMSQDQAQEVATLQARLAKANADSDAAIARAQAALEEVEQRLVAAASSQQRVASLEEQVHQLATQVSQQSAELDTARASVLEAASLRGQLATEKERAAHAVQQAEELLRASAAMGGVEGMERKLLELTDACRSKEQRIEHLEATVHQECAERTVLLEQLNGLRKDASMPPLLPAEVRSMAAGLLLKQASASAAAPPRAPGGVAGTGPVPTVGGGGVTLPRIPSRGSVPDSAGSAGSAPGMQPPRSARSTSSTGSAGGPDGDSPASRAWMQRMGRRGRGRGRGRRGR